MPSKWNHAVCNLLKVGSLTQHNNFNKISPSCRYQQFVPVHCYGGFCGMLVPQFRHPATCWRVLGGFRSLTTTGKASARRTVTHRLLYSPRFCRPKSGVAGGQIPTSLCKNLPNHCPHCLSHFTFSFERYEISRCSMCLSALGVFSIFFF